MWPASTRIFVCTQPVDLRKSFDGLAQCTREILACDPSVVRCSCSRANAPRA
jgi:hypothetical protein